jgi:hypothetical protein
VATRKKYQPITLRQLSNGLTVPSATIETDPPWRIAAPRAVEATARWPMRSGTKPERRAVLHGQKSTRSHHRKAGVEGLI